MAMQLRDSLTTFGAKSLLPAVIVFSLLKETGPVITGLVVAGRVGAGIGAELGSMKVTEQIDAMEASAVDPFRFLVGTRVIACFYDAAFANTGRGLLRHRDGLDRQHTGRADFASTFHPQRDEGCHLPRLSPADIPDDCLWLIIGIVACFQGMRTRGEPKVSDAPRPAPWFFRLCS
jgi:phospholipid/cholesterol/gamma-HCH transport system permease protein